MLENQKIWQYLIEFYEDWIKDGHDFLPLLNLIKWLSESKYKDEIYPNKSHTTLNISAVEGFQKQMNYPSISVQYYDKTFRITYVTNQNQTHNLEKYTCHETQVFSLLESLLIRLETETEIKRKQLYEKRNAR